MVTRFWRCCRMFDVLLQEVEYGAFYESKQFS